MDHQSLIRWLRECYREDHTRAGVRDFVARSMENRLMVKGEDKLGCGFLDEDILAPAYAEKLMLNLSLHDREKEFLYGCLFFLGKVGGKVYRAPLILYPATVKRYGETISVSLEYSLYRINYSLLDVLDNKQQIEQGIMEALRGSEGVLTSVAVSGIAEVFRGNMSEVNVNKLIEWPHVSPVSAVNSKLGTGLRIISAAGWGVVKRSRGSSGVVDELEKLGEFKKENWSSALEALFFDGVRVKAKPSVVKEQLMKPTLAPVLLSENQDHLLKSARFNALTVCHGPPGTGKSFTLAAIAIDHIARGETVLIVSKKDHAVDVLYEKTKELLESRVAIVRAGRSDYLKNLKARVSKILSTRHPSPLEANHRLGGVTQKLMDLLEDIARDESQLTEEYAKSIARGEVSAKPNPRWYERLLKLWYEGKVKGRPVLIQLCNHLGQLHQQREVTIRKLIRTQQDYLLNSVMADARTRGDLKKLLTALKKTKSSEQLAAFSSADFDSVLNVFPIWITSLSDLHRVLPPKQEMFDVVIIDEASQCDIASALPAIQRAKRVVIAGDEKQLRHVSFIARNSMDKFARDLQLSEEDRAKYDYRDVSLMDLAIENTHDGSQVALLNEHFRSLKPIIEFSNTEFYQGDLRLMRDRPWERVSERALVFNYCEGDRGEDGVNEGEISAVIVELLRLLDEGEKSDEPLKSIGILSPFRSQVDALTDAVNELAVEAEYVYRLSRHQLKVGTAHSFQGEERDVMLISVGLGKSDNAGTRRFIEQEDVFNVSITRAKHQQVIFHSVKPQDLPIHSLLGKYLSFSGKGDSNSGQYEGEGRTDEVNSFAIEFTKACGEKGITSKMNETVAAIPVDVLLEKNGRYLGVDLVGYPGFTQNAVGINRHQILERAGMKLVPVGYVEWQVQPENVLNAVEKLLNQC
ncbi:MAG: DEAD/DEAH box helicase [Akkermansiaceae bacterium]